LVIKPGVPIRANPRVNASSFRPEPFCKNVFRMVVASICWAGFRPIRRILAVLSTDSKWSEFSPWAHAGRPLRDVAPVTFSASEFRIRTLRMSRLPKITLPNVQPLKVMFAMLRLEKSSVTNDHPTAQGHRNPARLQFEPLAKRRYRRPAFCYLNSTPLGSNSQAGCRYTSCHSPIFAGRERQGHFPTRYATRRE
jgi:hypothetical protein